jgi:hypothetical protein
MMVLVLFLLMQIIGPYISIALSFVFTLITGIPIGVAL